jgi:hypothetical protein
VNPQTLISEYLRLVECSGALDLEHMRSMCIQVSQWLVALEGREGAEYQHRRAIETMLKTSRWIGYLQRWLETRGLRTLDQLRNETRGLDAVLIGYL